MFDKSKITNTYEVDEDLRKQLEGLRNTARIKILQNRQVELPHDIPARQFTGRVSFAGETVTIFNTVSSLGIFSSYQRNQSMAAVMILAESLQYGEPTLVYEDHATVRQHESDYLDLTAEWYHDPFVKKRVPELRMESRSEMFDAEELSLEALEDRTKRWFASH